MFQEFADVFPHEVLGLPTKRDIDFTINLVLKEALVSKSPYNEHPRIGRVEDATTRVDGQTLYKAKCVSFGSANVICKQ